MGLSIKDEIQYYSFKSFNEFQLPHGVFMRHGGVSPKPWWSLNLGGNIGDSRGNIIENRKRIFDTLEKPVESLFDVWQVHSDKVICTDQPRPLNETHQLADAILTDNPEVTLFMRFADCVPIFLFDPNHRVIGMVHAGWQGTVNKIVTKTINRMTDVYQSTPQEIIAGIGPSICVQHYPVREDVISQVQMNLGFIGDESLVKLNGNTHFDLQKANLDLLRSMGLLKIEVSGICTACSVENWFSHRGENGETGRFGALIAL